MKTLALLTVILTISLFSASKGHDSQEDSKRGLPCNDHVDCGDACLCYTGVCASPSDYLCSSSDECAKVLKCVEGVCVDGKGKCQSNGQSCKLSSDCEDSVCHKGSCCYPPANKPVL